MMKILTICWQMILLLIAVFVILVLTIFISAIIRAIIQGDI